MKVSAVRKVFLSSTGDDLREWREVVAHAINRVPGYECINMETWLPDSRPSRRLLDAKVDESDLFVGLIGFHYGSRGTNTKSWTRLEYERAKGKDRRMFVAPYGTPLPHLERLADDDEKRQTDFRDRIRKDGTTSREHAWANEHAMAAEVLLVLIDGAFGDVKGGQDKYEARLLVETERLRAELEDAASEDRARLQQELDGQIAKLRDVETAYADMQAVNEGLRTELALRNSLDPDLRDRAQAAIEDEDLDTARELFTQLAKAFQDQRRLEDDRRAQENREAARTYYQLGQIAEEQVRWHNAADHYDRAAELDRSFDHLYKSREFQWRCGSYPRAEVIGTALLSVARSEFGKQHEKFAVALNEHALTLQALGRLDKAEPLFRQAIDIGKETIGARHPDYAIRLNNLATLLKSMQRLEEAKLLFRQAIDIDKETIGEWHPDYAIHLNNLANLHREMGQMEAAETLFRQAIVIDKETIGERHPGYSIRLSNLAGLLRETGRREEAEQLYRQAVDIDKVAVGEQHPSYATHLNNLANLLRETGRREEAEPLFRQAVEVFNVALGAEHPSTKSVAKNLELFLAERDSEA